jgi:glycerol kinase
VKQSERISLPGSFLASLLIGKYAETDLSEASLAGIWNRQEQALENRLVDLGKDTKAKLGSLTSTSESLGHLTSYCAKRWRMSTSTYSDRVQISVSLTHQNTFIRVRCAAFRELQVRRSHQLKSH